MKDTNESVNVPREDLRMSHGQMRQLADFKGVVDAIKGAEYVQDDVVDSELLYRYMGLLHEADIQDEKGLNATGLKTVLSGLVLGTVDTLQAQDRVAEQMQVRHLLPGGEDSVVFGRFMGSVRDLRRNLPHRGQRYDEHLANQLKGVDEYLEGERRKQTETALPDPLELMSLGVVWGAADSHALRQHITDRICKKYSY